MTTRILFAFGLHGNRSEGRGPDRQFFRNAITPFLEDIAKSGGKAVIVKEGAVGTKNGIDEGRIRRVGALYERKMKGDRLSTKDESSIDRLELQIAKLRVGFNHMFERTIDAGKEAEGLIELDWGFDDVVLEINRKNPGRIRTLIEPMRLETEHQSLKSRDLFVKINPFDDDVKGHMKMCVGPLLRDAQLADLVRRLAQADGETAFIIPRGAAHRPMTRLFESEFKLEVKEAAECTENPFLKAVISHYYRLLDEVNN